MRIIDTSSVTLDEGRAWATARGGHPRYIAVAALYWELAPLFGIPPEIPYGQAAKETAKGHYTGVVGPERHNWCGLKTAKGGGNSDPDAHQVFRDDRAGATAHLWHLYGYTGRKQAEGPNLPMLDPRFHLISDYTETVEGLGGADSWAPSPTYGVETAAIVQDLRDFARNITGSIPMPGPYEHVIPGLVDLRSVLQRNPRGGSEGRLALTQKRGLVVHFNGPDVGPDDRQHIINVAAYHCTKDFSANGSGAIGDGIMYHVAIADDGTAYLTRDLEAGLWHCGHAWNRHSLAVYCPIGINQRVTERQRQRLIEVAKAWLRFTGEGREAVKGHQELSATDCPGSLMADFVRPFRAGEFSGGEPAVEDPAPAVDPNAQHFPQTDKWIVNQPGAAMLTAWRNKGGVAVCGYPLTGMTLDGDGVYRQCFENVLIEIYPDGLVRFGGLGQRYMAALARIADLEAA